jgi:hypothetical protein
MLKPRSRAKQFRLPWGTTRRRLRNGAHAVQLLDPAMGGLPNVANDPLPAIVIKAEEDARARLALQRLGYVRVLRIYFRHRRERRTVFHHFSSENLWPAMDFVRQWLKHERRRVVADHHPAFLLTMLVTMVAGFAFLCSLFMLG